jgi:hypothetical protein
LCGGGGALGRVLFREVSRASVSPRQSSRVELRGCAVTEARKWGRGPSVLRGTCQGLVLASL